MSCPNDNYPEADGQTPAEEITHLLRRIQAGDATASDRLMWMVYHQLHRLASRLRAEEVADPTLGTTALLHEAYIKLARSEAFGNTLNRAHFFALASRAMRQVIVDHARRQKTQKRAHFGQRMHLDAVLAYFQQRRWDALKLDETMCELAEHHSRPAQVVELRFFGGMTTQDIAETLGVSVSTVEGDWRFARAYLRAHLQDDSVMADEPAG